MKPALQPVGYRVDTVKIAVGGRPACGCQVYPPTAFPRPEKGFIRAGERRALIKVEEESLGLVPFGRMAARLQDAPPWDTAAIVAHDGPHLPRSP